MSYENKKLKEFNEYIRFRKVAVIGLGVSNLPLLEYLHNKKAQVTVFDERTEEEIPMDTIAKIKTYEFEASFGKNCLEKLKRFNVIFRSPSCLPTRPELKQEADMGAIVTTEVEMLMEMCPCKIIGVTGSDGKTTTTSLINAILQHAGYKTFLGGNIGTPLFTKLPEMEPNDIVVLELSSFQLMNMHVSPDIAVITNITPNHLNVHKDYQEYINAKKNIYRNQKDTGILVINADNDLTRECQNDAKGDVILFSSKQKLDYGFIVENGIVKECNDGIRKHIVSQDEIKLKGIHNLEKNLKGNINAFSGNSGVGKSTLINAIFKDTITQEGEISQRNKKGKNTTTSTKLYEIDENTYIADTPGFSTFDISEIEYRELDKYFKEFKPLLDDCEFVGCTHIKEENCGIKQALQQGKIDNGRYERFCKIYEELKEKDKYKY